MAGAAKCAGTMACGAGMPSRTPSGRIAAQTTTPDCRPGLMGPSAIPARDSVRLVRVRRYSSAPRRDGRRSPFRRTRTSTGAGTGCAFSV